MEHDPLRRAVAEFIGTFALIFFGAGAVMVGSGGLVGVALAHGLAIAIMVSAFAHISGGHFNPAITFAFVVTRRISAGLAAVYWVAQLAGATVAALLLDFIYGGPLHSFRTTSHLGAPALASQVNSGRGFLIEAVLTLFLVLAVFATAVDPRGTFKAIAGLAIGLTITMDVLMGGPLTGAAMNPARAFGPMLVGNAWQRGWWIYYTAPVAGAVVAGLVYELLYLRPPKPEPVGTPESGVVEPRPGDAAAS